MGSTLSVTSSSSSSLSLTRDLTPRKIDGNPPQNQFFRYTCTDVYTYVRQHVLGLVLVLELELVLMIDPHE